MKPGKKTLAWDAAKRKLKQLFDQKDIRRCEICGSTSWLTWAHSLKRRNAIGDLLYQVILACIKCHETIEKLGEPLMYEKVIAVIQARGWDAKDILGE